VSGRNAGENKSLALFKKENITAALPGTLGGGAKTAGAEGSCITNTLSHREEKLGVKDHQEVRGERTHNKSQGDLTSSRRPDQDI